MQFSQGQIWYERALFYGQKGDQVNARRAYNIALRHDPTLPPLPKFRNHALLKKLERICLLAALILLCWLLYMLFLGPTRITGIDFPWRLSFLHGAGPASLAPPGLKGGPAVEAEPPVLAPTACEVSVYTWEVNPSPQVGSEIRENPRYANPDSHRTAAGPAGFGPYESYALLRNALYCYARDQGHFPERLEQLVQARYLERIPADPLRGSRQVHSRFNYSGGWVYIQPPTYAAPHLREQVEMAVYINAANTPLTPFVPRSLEVDPGGPSLTLREGAVPLQTWPVSLGTAATPTPAGNYLIVDKQILDNTANANPFGSRWLKLGEQYPYSPAGQQRNTAALDTLSKRGIGIHGTNQSASIGNFTTAGCIRLSNADVEELYQHVPNGITITIGPSF